MPAASTAAPHDRLHAPRRLRRALRKGTAMASLVATLSGVATIPAFAAPATPTVRAVQAPAATAVLNLGGTTMVVDEQGRVKGGGPFGSLEGLPLAEPVTAAARTRTGQGYWMAARDGGVFAFGDAAFAGSLAGAPLNAPIVGMAGTPTARGYWLVGSDGGIFSFGDARFRGSLGGQRLNEPIVAMAATRSGAGYWLVAQDGGVFAFGDASFHGSAAGSGRSFQSIVPTPAGDGYWLVGSDGFVQGFGSAATTQLEVPDGYEVAAAVANGSSIEVAVADVVPVAPPGGLAVCPIDGPSDFIDSWGFPRSGGRSHRGVDMMAASGLPVVAPVSGVVAHRSNRIGGLSFHLNGDDGNYYYGTHLSRYGASGRVEAGDVIGYVGDTGNAAGMPQLHFEVHPGRNGAVNPYSRVASVCDGAR